MDGDLDIEMFRGDEARRLLAADEFLAGWGALCDRCPWSTGFQSPAFARAWYSTYGHRVEPVLALARTPAGGFGGLGGLLALAWSPSDRVLVPVGGWQAEYHAWVCDPVWANAFP